MKATKTPKSGKAAEVAEPAKITGQDVLTPEGMTAALLARGIDLAGLDGLMRLTH